ncbi:MAG: hypothetical protein WCH62_01335 [Candidatus Omnitrophota bacterium]
MILNRRKAFVLIFTVWVLGFLTVLVVGLAAGIRQKIVLLEKLDQRSRIRYLLEAAVKYSDSYIGSQFNSSSQYTVGIKMNLHNNPNIFSQFVLAGDTASISYTLPDQGEIFGVVDEERKINLNTTNVSILTRLIEKVLLFKSDHAQKLASDILDWRQFGQSQVSGFFSDEYYNNLEYPYVKKDANYETLDELLLVKGVTKEMYEKLINYVTIYGEGKVNINTAPMQVLYALGLEESLIEKILEVRQGKDKTEATADDYVFLKTFDVATEITTIVRLESTEVHAIDLLNKQNFLTTTSSYFSIEAQARLAHSLFSKKIRAVISLRENKIMYWRE